MELKINAPNTGISSSPHVGVGDCRNLDIFTIPGVARLNNLLAKKTSTTVTGTPQWMVKDPTTPANIYALDSGGKIYKSTDSGGTWAALAGQTFTVTIANPGVVTATAHGMVANDTFVPSTTGALPTGMTAGTTYYVLTTDLTANTFKFSTSQGGSAVETTGTQSGTHSLYCTTGATGQGLAIFEDYLIVARSTELDIYGPLSSSPTWMFSWLTIDSDTLWHPMTISKNDFMLYGGAGKYVYSLEELTGQTFAPVRDDYDTTTYTMTKQALDLPANYRIKCIEELGDNLMLGTWKGTNIYDYRIADIFPWDRVSVSFYNPIQMSENGVNAMLSINGILYVLAGIEGKLYQCSGAQAFPIAQIPSSVSNLEGGLYLDIYPQAITNYKGRVTFGISSGGSASTIDGIGVWSLMQTSKGNILSLEHGVSTGNFGSATTMKIGSLLPITRDTILVGWRDDTSYGIDKTTATSRVTSYGGYFESAYYHVGTANAKARISEIEFQLAKPLAENEGIKLKYRKDLNASFSTVGIFDYTTYGAIMGMAYPLPLPIIDCEFIQIRCELTGTSTTPQLRHIILR